MSFILSSCAVLHHVQVGEVDNRQAYTYTHFDVKVSETGIDIDQAKGIAKTLMNDRGKEQADRAIGIIKLFQMGPRTGTPVFVPDYAKDLEKVIRSRCPNGFITGLMSVRESRKYPVISGEIVKVTGYCATPIKTASNR